MYFVNLFGEGIRYWNCDIPISLFKEMDLARKKLESNWETLLFDQDFLISFGIKHWQELSETGERRALALKRENKIEIKERSKLIDKFKSIDLLGEETLFPKYSTSLKNENIPTKEEHQRMVLVHYETGLFNKYEFNISTFHLEHLCFIMVDPIPGITQQWLSGVELNGNKLESVKNDVLFRGCTIYLS